MYRKSSMTSAIVLLVIAALVVFIGYGSSIDGKWFQQSDMSKWYNSWGKGETVQSNDQTDNQNGSQNGNQNGNVTPVQTSTSNQMIVSDSEGFGLTLLCAPIDDLTVVSLAAPANYIEAYSLTVTYTPSYVNNPVFSWDVAFENSSSSWASGKNVSNYVVIDTDGSLNPSGGSCYAIAYCLQAFGEPIIITVSCGNYSASVTCDFLENVLSVGYQFDNQYAPLSLIGSNSDLIVSLPKFSSVPFSAVTQYGSSSYIKVSDSNQPYTLQDSVTSMSIELRSANSESAGIATVLPSVYNLSVSNAVSSCNSMQGFNLVSFLSLFCDSSNFVVAGDQFNYSHYDSFCSFASNYIPQNNTRLIGLRLTAHMQYGDDIVMDYNLYFDDNSPAFQVNSVSLADSSFVFGTQRSSSGSQNSGGSGAENTIGDGDEPSNPVIPC